MLCFCVNRAPQSANPCICRTSGNLSSKSFPHTFLATPHQLTPYLSHSYKNHRGVGSISPSSLFARSLRSLHKERFTSLLQSSGSALFLKNAGWYGSATPQLLKNYLKYSILAHRDFPCCFPSTQWCYLLPSAIMWDSRPIGNRGVRAHKGAR
jgi:hypothetical protein